MPSVLHIIDHPGLGGAQRLVNTILTHRPGDSVYALRSKPPHLIHQPAARWLLPAPPFFWAALLNLLRMPNLVRRQGFEIVHCHLSASWLAGIWLAVCLHGQHKPRFFFHAHNSEGLRAPGFRLIAQLVSRLGTIIVVSEYIHQQLVDLGIREDKLVILNNFVESCRKGGELGQGERLQFDPGWLGGGKLAGFAGRLAPVKGLSYLVEVMRLLKDEQVKFLIAGHGVYGRKLNRLIVKHGLQERVKLLGYLEEITHFFNTVDVFIAPSLMESFGLAHLEAQACGCPVVAFDIDSLRETLGAGNALLIPLGDTQALAKAVRQVLQDDALHQSLSTRGIENARRFKADIHLLKLEALYRSAAAHQD